MKVDFTAYDVKKIRPHDLEIDYVATRENPSLKIEVVNCSEYDALVQAVGYLKYNMPGPVFYRGQNRLYGTGSITPAIYRDHNRTKVEHLRNLLIHLAGSSCNKIWDDFSPCRLKSNEIVGKNLIFHDIPLYGLEGTLQHYGIKTRWIDITDSLPHALFFSIAQYTNLQITRQFSNDYFPQTGGSCCSRVMNNMVVDIDRHPETGSSCYLIALSPGNLCRHSIQSELKGLAEYTEGYVLDARSAIPSHYLRPHAQHGLLYKPKESIAVNQSIIFRLPVEKVRTWIGNGVAFSPSTIFPPVRRLNTDRPCANPTIAADKGLSDIEKNLIRIWNSAQTNTAFKTAYRPLLELTNYVTREELSAFKRFSGFENPSRRVDWDEMSKPLQ